MYVVASSAWSRATDFDGSPTTEVAAGDFFFVSSGTVNANTGWVLTTASPTVGSSSLAFAQVTSAGTTMTLTSAPAASVTNVYGGVANSLASFWLVNADNGTNEKIWRMSSDANGDFVIAADSDGSASSTDAIRISRSSYTATSMDVNGALAISGATTITGAVTAPSFSGVGTSLTALNASNVSTGTVATARLGSGTASSSTFLRGDNTWASIATTGTVTSVALSGGTTGLTVTGSPITSSGTLTLGGVLSVANGGTGQTTASAAINALVPSQTGNAGKYLTTNGTSVLWGDATAGASSLTGVTSVITPVTNAVVDTLFGGTSAVGPTMVFHNAAASTGNKTASIAYNSSGSLLISMNNDNSTATYTPAITIARSSGTNKASTLTLSASNINFVGTSVSDTGVGGTIAITGSPGGSTSGAGGAVTITGGYSPTGSGGTVTIAGGSSASGSAGAVVITSQSGVASTGQVSISTASGSAMPSGAITIGTGSTTAAGSSGSVTISSGTSDTTGTGAVTVSSGNGTSNNAPSGAVSIRSGSASGSGTSGAVSIRSGDGGSTGASGSVSISSGSAAGSVNAGDITIGTGSSTSTSSGTGHVYFQTNNGSTYNMTLWKSGRATFGASAAQQEVVYIEGPATEVSSVQYLFNVRDNTTVAANSSRVNRGLQVTVGTSTNVLNLVSTSDGSTTSLNGYVALNPLAIAAYTKTGASTYANVEIARFVPSHTTANAGSAQTNALLINKTAHSQNGVLQVVGDAELVGTTVIAASQPANNTAKSGLGALEVRGNVDINSTTTALRVRSTDATSASLFLQNSTTGTTITDGTRIGVESTGVDASIWNYETGYLRFATANTERFRILSNGAWSVGSTGTAYGTAGQVLTSNGNAAPTWQSVSVSSVSNLAGGDVGYIPYQSAASTTAFLSPGTAGQLLRCNGAAAPSWTTLSIAASSLTGTTLASSVVSSSLTSVGTLTSLTVSGAASFGATTCSTLAVSGTTSLTHYTELRNNVTAAASTTITCTAGNSFVVTLGTSITTLTFASIPANTRVYNMTLVLVQDNTGGRTVTWPSSVKWAGGIAPTLSTSGNATDVITLMTYDAGTTWLGFIAGQNF